MTKLITKHRDLWFVLPWPFNGIAWMLNMGSVVTIYIAGSCDDQNLTVALCARLVEACRRSVCVYSTYVRASHEALPMLALIGRREGSKVWRGDPCSAGKLAN